MTGGFQRGKAFGLLFGYFLSNHRKYPPAAQAYHARITELYDKKSEVLSYKFTVYNS